MFGSGWLSDEAYCETYICGLDGVRCVAGDGAGYTAVDLLVPDDTGLANVGGLRCTENEPLPDIDVPVGDCFAVLVDCTVVGEFSWSSHSPSVLGV